MLKKKEKTDFLQLLIEAAENTLQAAKLFGTVIKEQTHPASHLAQFKELENKGDSITHRIFIGLSQVFITPIDREDIMELAVKLDDVIDGIEATIARFDYLNISQTDSYMRDFADTIIASCRHILESIILLSQKKYIQITEHTIEINRLENEGDRIMREGIREIFTHPKDPYQDFKLKEIYERLEETTDSCEDVADILESMVLRYA